MDTTYGISSMGSLSGVVGSSKQVPSLADIDAFIQANKHLQLNSNSTSNSHLNSNSTSNHFQQLNSHSNSHLNSTSNLNTYPSSTYSSSVARDMFTPVSPTTSTTKPTTSTKQTYQPATTTIPTSHLPDFTSFHLQPTTTQHTSTISHSNLASSILSSTTQQPTHQQQHSQPQPTHFNYLETISNRETKKHNEQMFETQEAAVRVIASKEQEISRLQGKIQELEASLTSKDEQLAIAGRDLNKLQMLQQIELDNIRTQQIQMVDQKNTDAYKKFQDELKAQDEAHQRTIESINSLWQQKIAAVEANRVALVEAIQTKDQQFEMARDDRVRSMQADYQAQTVQLHEMLNAESTRLAEARNEVHSLSEARKNDLISLKAKLQELMKIATQKEHDYILGLQNAKDQFSFKEEEYKSQLRALRSNQQIELDQKLSYIRQLEEKLFSIDKLFSETKSDFNARENSNHNFIQSLKKEVGELQQSSSQKELEWRYWGQKCHKLETENSMLKNELSLLENEDKRLREVVTYYENEITRLDHIVYGGKSSRMTKTHPSRFKF